MPEINGDPHPGVPWIESRVTPKNIASHEEPFTAWVQRVEPSDEVFRGSVSFAQPDRRGNLRMTRTMTAELFDREYTATPFGESEAVGVASEHEGVLDGLSAEDREAARLVGMSEADYRKFCPKAGKN